MNQFIDFGTQLVRVMASALVDHPNQVRVSAHEGPLTVVFTVRVADSDLGQVLGKNGLNALAMRRILIAFAAKQKLRAIIEIEEGKNLKLVSIAA